MRVENILNFAIDEIQPMIPGTVVVDSDEVLGEVLNDKIIKNRPDQVHTVTKGSFGEIQMRIANSQNLDEQVITVFGANYEASPVFVIHVNGDASWKRNLEEKIGILKADPYLCTPQGD